MIEFQFGPKSKVKMKIARLENVPQSGTTAVSARPPAAQARGISSGSSHTELCGVFCGHRGQLPSICCRNSLFGFCRSPNVFRLEVTVFSELLNLCREAVFHDRIPK